MSQQINVRLFGFIIGKYTYFWKKKQLYRQNKKNGVIMLKIQPHGGSLGYDIQKAFYKMDNLDDITTTVIVVESHPF